MKHLILNFALILFLAAFSSNLASSQTPINIELVVNQPQRYGILEVDYFIISTTPGGPGILIHGESPTGSTTGMLIYRANADQFKTWGPIGANTTWPYPGQTGTVSYENIMVPSNNTTYYLRIRYSKHSPSIVPIEIYVNDELIATYIPENRGSWENFGYSEDFSFELNPVDCATPEELSSSTLGSTEVELSWLDNAEADQYFIRLREIETTNWNEWNANTSSITLSGLKPATTYEYQVAASCCLDGISDWSTTMTFTTASELMAKNQSAIRNNLTVSNPDSKLLSVYPNPSSDLINLHSDQALKGDVQITNSLGTVMLLTNVNGQSLQIPIQDFPVGKYFLSFFSAQGEVYTYPFSKQ